MKNRTYRYFKGKPLYAFGHGLSYTRFEYSDMQIVNTAPDLFRLNGTIKNTGEMDGEEVVQLYISLPGSADAPVRSLKGFKRIMIKKGESQTVAFEITKDDMAVLDEKGNPLPVSGEVRIYIGGGQPGTSSVHSANLLIGSVKL
jgi:beta-glucosidase